jgi:hypothetical protein
LRHLLQQRRQALLTKALQSEGQVDAQELESLGRLEKLYDLSTAKALTVEILIGGVVVLCVLSLFLLRVPEAGIELHAEATKVRFELRGKTAVSGTLPVRWITVQGHKQVSISPAGPEGVIKQTAPVFTAQIADSKSAAMSLMIPDLPARSLVELSHWPDGTREIAFCDLDRPVPLLISSRVQIQSDTTLSLPAPPQVRVLFFPTPQDDSGQPVNATHPCQRSAMLHFRFAPAKAGDFEFSRDLTVHDLQLYEGPQASGQLLSTLVSGQFRLSSSKASPTILLPNDLLELGSSSGRMRSITMGEKTTKFDFQGKVKSLSIGSATMRRSIMPSMLEWWLSQDLIFVAWSAGLSCIAFLLGVYQWILKRK